MEKEILKVGAKTDPNKLAGAIAGTLKQNKEVEIHAIGAGAVNQAVKALAVTRSFTVLSGGEDVAFQATFGDTILNGEEKTTIILSAFYRK